MTDTQARAIAADMLEVGHFVFDGVSWDFYRYVLRQRERSGFYARVTYDGGLMDVLTGASREASFEGRLSCFLGGFSFDDEEAPRLVSDLAALDDIAYFATFSRLGRGLDSEEGSIRVSREKLVWSEAGCSRRPGPLRFHARFPVVPSAFPGIDVDLQRGFFNFDWKGKPQ